MKTHVLSRGGSPTPAVTAAVLAGANYVLHHYEHEEDSLSYGREAAHAMESIGVEAARVYKTLVARADTRFVMALVSTSTKIDFKALAAAMGAKHAELASPADAERVTGYVIGGISPLGTRRRLRTVVDESAPSWPTIFVSAGRRGLELEIAPSELVRLTGAIVARLSR